MNALSLPVLFMLTDSTVLIADVHPLTYVGLIHRHIVNPFVKSNAVRSLAFRYESAVVLPSGWNQATGTEDAGTGIAMAAAMIRKEAISIMTFAR